MADIMRATAVDEEVDKAVEDLFAYHQLEIEQVQKGNLVRNALASAVRVIIQNVPPSPDRSAAIRKVRESRMDCLSAISHGGRY